MNTLPIKKDSLNLEAVEYIPTVDDLDYIFRNVQPPDKVPVDIVKFPVQAVAKQNQMIQHGSLFVIARDVEKEKQTIAYITLKKFRDGEKDIWIYEGKVKQ